PPQEQTVAALVTPPTTRESDIAGPAIVRDIEPGQTQLTETADLVAFKPGRDRSRPVTILQIGDSHTAADFFTGELRKRLQARYGDGGVGYVTAGRPHIGVQNLALKAT